MTAGRAIAKRLLDVAVSAACLVAFSPLLLPLAFFIYCAMGRPVFFRQTRLGHRGRPFVLYKLRTMADGWNSEGDLLPDSERITVVGRFLRRTSLDELPQLWNVLRGDMSLVGPRPLLPEYWDLYTPEQRRRHDVRPGITGAVQARGRNALSWDEKFRLDNWYVDNWSFWGDVRILFASVRKVLTGEGIAASGSATMPVFEGTTGQTMGDATHDR